MCLSLYIIIKDLEEEGAWHQKSAGMPTQRTSFLAASTSLLMCLDFVELPLFLAMSHSISIYHFLLCSLCNWISIIFHAFLPIQYLLINVTTDHESQASNKKKQYF